MACSDRFPMGPRRITFIVPLGPGALGGIRRWRDLCDSESEWQDWALSRVALPPAAEIMS